jgi:hypothetical protein
MTNLELYGSGGVPPRPGSAFGPGRNQPAKGGSAMTTGVSRRGPGTAEGDVGRPGQPPSPFMANGGL